MIFISFKDIHPDREKETSHRNNIYSLLITGVGRKKVSNTLPIYLKRIYNPDSILINIGIAGGNPHSTKIGNMYYIDKLTSELSNNEYSFPVIYLFKIKFDNHYYKILMNYLLTSKNLCQTYAK